MDELESFQGFAKDFWYNYEKREARITDMTGKFTFKVVETIWGIVSVVPTMNTMDGDRVLSMLAKS